MTDEEEFEKLIDRLIAESVPVSIDPQNVPDKFHVLIPMAERWGVSEDGLRWNILKRASDKELKELESRVRPYYAELDEWLAGPEAEDPDVSDEYIAFTCMRLATDEGAIMLEKRSQSSKEVKQPYLPGFEDQ